MLDNHESLLICFLDWGRKMIVGDVKEQSVQEIWDGKQMRSYRKMFLEGKRKQHQTCGNCGQMTHGLPDNIDPYKVELLGKLNDLEYFEGVNSLNLKVEPIGSIIPIFTFK